MSAISRCPIPKLDDLPADIRGRILAVREKAGFIPTVFLALADLDDRIRWIGREGYHDRTVGFIVDAHTMPPEVQAEARRRGLIPDLPGPVGKDGGETADGGGERR